MWKIPIFQFYFPFGQVEGKGSESQKVHLVMINHQSNALFDSMMATFLIFITIEDLEMRGESDTDCTLSGAS